MSGNKFIKKTASAPAIHNEDVDGDMEDEQVEQEDLVTHQMKKKKLFVPKTTMKRSHEDGPGIGDDQTPSAKRMEWLKEKAKDTKIPEETKAVLNPAHIYYEHGPLIVHMCYDCKKFNSQRQAAIVGPGRVQLPLGLCTICRQHFNHQRSIRFFEHELPAIKKTFSL